MSTPERCGEAAVVVRGLCVTTADGRRCLVDDASLELEPGEVLGIVGESGSGKTTLGLALLHHCRRGLCIGRGTIRVAGRDLGTAAPEELRQLRGRLVCYVPQDPASALNPALRIGTQLAECLEPRARRDRTQLLDLLSAVKLPPRESFLESFPHQLSGGQLQRVAIAMAFANRPRLIVMDEPTTGLDVTTQAHVLDTVRQLCDRHHVAAIYVSHDIAVVAAIARRVAVVYAGRIVEIGPTERVLRGPAHPYTRALIHAVPDIDDATPVSGIPGHAPEAGAEFSCCSFAPRCTLAVDACREHLPDLLTIAPGHEVRCPRSGDRENLPPRGPVAVRETSVKPLLAAHGVRAFYGRREVLHGVTFEVGAGECVALVGESGSGKTTLARCIGGLHAEARGTMTFHCEPLPLDTRVRSAATRRRIQYIFQNPYGSFNPRRSIGASLALTLSQFEKLTSSERRGRVLAALDQVSLPASMAERYPRDLSGGQRQRAAIARALITDPELLICDEITSALDVSVQAVITELLSDLQRERGLAMLFVTHNLAVVRGLAQRIVVMQGGHLVEEGPTDAVMRHPQSDETKRLLRDAPRFTAAGREAAIHL
ncbi:MAG: ABC transporter ATP-binding protein [Steroidobacteraceae bacterium]